MFLQKLHKYFRLFRRLQILMKRTLFTSKTDRWQDSGFQVGKDHSFFDSDKLANFIHRYTLPFFFMNFFQI